MVSKIGTIGLLED